VCGSNSRLYCWGWAWHEETFFISPYDKTSGVQIGTGIAMWWPEPELTCGFFDHSEYEDQPKKQARMALSGDLEENLKIRR